MIKIHTKYHTDIESNETQKDRAKKRGAGAIDLFLISHQHCNKFTSPDNVTIEVGKSMLRFSSRRCLETFDFVIQFSSVGTNDRIDCCSSARLSSAMVL
jgi:hypothetical protein